jgi:hypothetical protein
LVQNLEVFSNCWLKGNNFFSLPLCHTKILKKKGKLNEKYI